MRFTIFTSTFNRGYIIQDLYHSLKNQTFKDFEWIVIDDCSDDETQDLLYNWIKEDNFFKITYFRCGVRGGKHRAINKGLDLAQGELFFIVDSDDKLPPSSLEIIDIVEKSVPTSERLHFAGVCGQRGTFDGCVIGTIYENDVFLDITMLERQKYNITGDKAEVFYTELLKNYKFPEYEGENFITECVVWDKIAYDGFKMRFFNTVVYLCEYLADGLSQQYWHLCYSNPKGYGTYLSQSIRYGKISRKEKWDAILIFIKKVAGYSFSEKCKFLHYNFFIVA